MQSTDLERLVMDMVFKQNRRSKTNGLASKYVENYTAGYIQNVVKTSSTTKARLLHYFPPDGNDNQSSAQIDSLDSWCGTTQLS